jgi:hypothetical protein
MAATNETVNEPTVQLHFSEAVPPEQRIVVERSIQTMAARSAEERDRARAAEAEQAKLQAALDNPLKKLIEQDPAAAKQLQELLVYQQPLVDIASLLREELPTEAEDATLVLRDVQTRVHGPPYHFDWTWHRTDGRPPREVTLKRPTGEVGLQARSGPLVEGADKFVEAHAGFGLLFRPPVDGLLRGDSLRRMFWSYVVIAIGAVGCNATSEGGTECTILEDGQLRQRAVHRLWRKRVSNGEHDVADSQGLITDTPMPLQWPMRAGHEYTFNVGVWVYTDNTSGVGQSGAVSVIRGVVPGMTITAPV